jgi:hypothetical protein
MNKQHIISAVFAVTSLGLASFKANAASLSYSDGDVLLGFYATGGTGATSTYVVDIGQASQFLSRTTPLQLSLGNIGADLVATYGADWNTRADLYWGFFGATDLGAVGSDPVYTLYASNNQAKAYAAGSGNTQSQPANKINAAGVAFGSNYPSSTANSNFAVVEGTGDPNSFASFQNSTTQSFSYFQNAMGNFGSGTAATPLEFYRMFPGSVAVRNTTDLGKFTINDSGVVTFTPVPEPSTCAILTVGLAALLLAKGRNRRFRAV